jgi:hypothetical protein
MDNFINLKLSIEEALVLYELLSRYEESGNLSILYQTESRVLWNILALLQKELVEPFQPDYDKQLENARNKLAS